MKVKGQRPSAALGSVLSRTVLSQHVRVSSLIVIAAVSKLEESLFLCGDNNKKMFSLLMWWKRSKQVTETVISTAGQADLPSRPDPVTQPGRH